MGNRSVILRAIPERSELHGYKTLYFNKKINESIQYIVT
jgi:hypothetical protein